MQSQSNGRVRRPEAEWRVLLSQWQASGQSLREFCRDQKIQISSFQRWRARLASSSASSAFVAVTPMAPPAAPEPWSFEVILPNGCILRFQG
jgi:hypothetical protein